MRYPPQNEDDNEFDDLPSPTTTPHSSGGTQTYRPAVHNNQSPATTAPRRSTRLRHPPTRFTPMFS